MSRYASPDRTLVQTADVAELLQQLPPVVYIRDQSEPRRIIAIKRGVMGKFPIRLHPSKRRTPADFNDPRVTPQQIAAMEAGSIFGWEVPGANPANYDEATERDALTRTEARAAEMFARYGDVEPEPYPQGRHDMAPPRCASGNACHNPALPDDVVCGECRAAIQQMLRKALGSETK